MNLLELTKHLVGFSTPSFTSNLDVSDFMESQLKSLEFETERVEYRDASGVLKVNILGRRMPTDLSDDEPGLAYFGHSDVVPADNWTAPSSDPFRAEVHEQRLYGRGSCDMKGSLACMLNAIERLSSARLKAPLYYVCTADEEVSYRGAKQVVRASEVYRQMVSVQPRVLIGEPTRLEVVHAHKGICGFKATSQGEAAHSGTAEGKNANLAMIPFLQEMKAIHDETEAETQWQNHEFDPSSVSWNIGINDHTKALNMKPAQSICTVFFRPLPGIDETPLLDRARAAASRCGLEFTMYGHCAAVYTAKDNPALLDAVQLADREQPVTVSYGTDAGELTELQSKFVCGPGDIAQAHTPDEWIDVSQLEAGAELYEKFLRAWCMT